jgi:ParB family chromosome partitioning protein
MKRQALGRGLSSLIPEKGKDPLAGIDLRSPRKSAADTRPETRKQATGDALAQPGEAGAMAMGTLGGPAAEEAARTERLSPEARAAGTLQWVDIDLIHPNPYQPRRQFQEAEIEELAASIRSSGILQPIILRRIDSGFGIVAGERRWRAGQRAGLLKVPAIVREIAEDRLLETALIENIQRQNLNPIEEARAYQSLIEDFGLTQAEVAEKVGRQRSTIANSVRLLDLPQRVQEMVEQGVLTMGHAKALSALPGAKAQEVGAGIIAKGGLSVRETESWVKRHTQSVEPAGAQQPRPDPHIRAAEEALQQALGTKVRIQTAGGEKGRILIEYYSSEELNRLYDRLVKR